MQKKIATFLFFFICTLSFVAAQRKVTTYLLAQYNKTMYDRTLGNNPWGLGLGLQTVFNNKTKFKPTIELTGDIYLEDDKILKLDPDGSVPTTSNDVRGMVNLFFGSSFQPAEGIYLLLVAGPSFINGQVLLGIKPSVGFYFSKNRRWTGNLSYINVFNRCKIVKEDFGSLSIGLGFKLF